LYGNDKEIEEVKIVKLDDFLKNKKIDLMKVDTQGWEPEVIEGAKKIISKNKPIMFLEYSPASYQIAKLDGQKMMKNLRKIYKNIWWINEWLYIYKNLKQQTDPESTSKPNNYLVNNNQELDFAISSSDSKSQHNHNKDTLTTTYKNNISKENLHIPYVIFLF
jgi:hypothetical protein